MSFAEEEYIDELEEEAQILSDLLAKQGKIIRELRAEIIQLQETIIIRVQEKQANVK